MRSSQDKMDLLFHSYSKKWLHSLKRQHPSSSLGYFITVMFIFLWASDLTIQAGFHPARGIGGLVFVGIGFGLGLIVILFNSLLAYSGIDRPVRSGLWMAAVVGPYFGLSSFSRWQNPTLSHLVGFGSAVIAFWLSFILDRLVHNQAKSTLPDASE